MTRDDLFSPVPGETDFARKAIWFDEEGRWMAYRGDLGAALHRLVRQYARQHPVWVWHPGYTLPKLDLGTSALTPEAVTMKLVMQGHRMPRSLLYTLERLGGMR